jgi:hypothetical protein
MGAPTPRLLLGLGSRHGTRRMRLFARSVAPVPTPRSLRRARSISRRSRSEFAERSRRRCGRSKLHAPYSPRAPIVKSLARLEHENVSIILFTSALVQSRSRNSILSECDDIASLAHLGNATRCESYLRWQRSCLFVRQRTGCPGSCCSILWSVFGRLYSLALESLQAQCDTKKSPRLSLDHRLRDSEVR